MKKFKKFLSYIILIFVVFGMVGLLFLFLPKNSQVDKPSIDNTDGYAVTYCSVNNDKVSNVCPFLFMDNASYPTNYQIGMSLNVSDLHGKMTKGVIDGQEYYFGSGYTDPENSRKTYEFYGWYLDKELTTEFDGVLGDNEVGNITLFAKITVSSWTNLY